MLISSYIQLMMSSSIKVVLHGGRLPSFQNSHNCFSSTTVNLQCLESKFCTFPAISSYIQLYPAISSYFQLFRSTFIKVVFHGGVFHGGCLPSFQNCWKASFAHFQLLPYYSRWLVGAGTGAGLRNFVSEQIQSNLKGASVCQ